MTAPPMAPSTAEYPLVVRRYLGHLLIQRMLRDHDGWGGVMQWLLCGTVRNSLAVNPERIPYAATPEYLLPIVTAEAEAWDRARRSAAA